MAATQGIVRYHLNAQTITFRVEGRAVMNLSLPLRRCAERHLATGTMNVLVDLRDCNYMDSTFMGTLLTLKKSLDRTPGGGELTLVAPSESCCKILNQMGLTDVFPAQAVALDPQATWTELPASVDDVNSFKRNIAQAHEELAALPGPAGEQFQAVARCLAESNKTDNPPK